MTIECPTTDQLVEIVAGLVRKGLCFYTTQSPSGVWLITLTGGY